MQAPPLTCHTTTDMHGIVRQQKGARTLVPRLVCTSVSVGDRSDDSDPDRGLKRNINNKA